MNFQKNLGYQHLLVPSSEPDRCLSALCRVNQVGNPARRRKVAREKSEKITYTRDCWDGAELIIYRFTPLSLE